MALQPLVPVRQAQVVSMPPRRSAHPLRGGGLRGPRGLGDTSTIVSEATRFARGQVRGVVLKSQLTPDVELTGAEATGDQQPRSSLSRAFWQLAKPAMYVETTMGTVRIAPWGEPTMNLYPVLVVGTIVGVAALAGLIARGLSD